MTDLDFVLNHTDETIWAAVNELHDAIRWASTVSHATAIAEACRWYGEYLRALETLARERAGRLCGSEDAHV